MEFKCQGKFKKNKKNIFLIFLINIIETRYYICMRVLKMVKPLKIKELDDRALVEMALEGNQPAWREIVNRYYGKVMATAYRIHNNKNEVEDIVQNIFIELAKSLKNFKWEASLSTFIYRISVNTTYKYIKKNQKRKFVSDAVDFFSHMMNHGEDKENPFEILKKEDNIKALNAALKKLSTEKRVALVLFETEGLTLKEISEILKLPLQTVWSRVYNGRKDLLKILGRKKR